MTDMLDRLPRTTLDPARTTGLILCGMGGPDGPDAVQPFLRNLFRDPLIFPLPRPVAGLAGRLIAWRRAPEVRRRYARLGTRSVSPQLETTRSQGRDLAQRLTRAGTPTVSAAAMRYWHPYPDVAVAELREAGAEQFIVLPMYPQYSDATNGSTLAFVLAALADQAPAAAVHAVPDWHDLPGFIDALARPAIRALTAWAEDGAEPGACALVHVAHSLPQRFVDAGDPYPARTRETVRLTHARITAALAAAGHGAFQARLLAGGREPCLTFQSKVGPIRWLSPQIEQETPRLGARGCRRLFVQPVSFTCEHIETLLELDVELEETARASGITEFARGGALNLDDAWLASLAAHLRRTAFSTRETLNVAES